MPSGAARSTAYSLPTASARPMSLPASSRRSSNPPTLVRRSEPGSFDENATDGGPAGSAVRLCVGRGAVVLFGATPGQGGANLLRLSHLPARHSHREYLQLHL